MSETQEDQAICEAYFVQHGNYPDYDSVEWAGFVAGWEAKKVRDAGREALLQSLWNDTGLRMLMRPDHIREFQEYFAQKESNNG